jgi:4-hydroxy-tetrahydrodipicolinate synthase
MTNAILPRGVWPVMLTPFRNDRSIDWQALGALTEWYLKAGVAGIFADAQSAEVYQLTNQEKLDIAAAVVSTVDGRVPVIAGGFTAGSLPEQAEFFGRMADTGVRAVVLTTCQLSLTPQEDDAWLRTAERFLALTGDIPLGLYEMPTPYHRVLSPELIRWAASTGRFIFHKDTSCRSEMIARKIEAVRGSRLAFFNADTPTLLDSLQAGADGFSGIGANFVPEHYVWLCRHFEDDAEQAGRLQAFLTEYNAGMHRKYPACAKVFLSMRGLTLTPVCRGVDRSFTDHDRQWFTEFLESSRRIVRKLPVESSVVSG